MRQRVERWLALAAMWVLFHVRRVAGRGLDRVVARLNAIAGPDYSVDLNPMKLTPARRKVIEEATRRTLG